MGGRGLRAGVGGGDAGAARDSGSGSGGQDQALRDTRHGEVLLGVDTNIRADARRCVNAWRARELCRQRSDLALVALFTIPTHMPGFSAMVRVPTTVADLSTHPDSKQIARMTAP
ncbi:hypothetical protein GCM10010423_38180 [Streptomyces levis]|uniref:Uncharacterized protein n=1 Tax=Streptomyces levis TaxID=285566 RepID=A0ABN3NU36_9ACTN